jgi:uncharacterized protein (TIGR03032 family)
MRDGCDGRCDGSECCCSHRAVLTSQARGSGRRSEAGQHLLHRGLADWLLRNNVSLAFTSYQTGRLYLVGVDDQKRVAFQERFLARAMGLWADQQRMLAAAIFQVWRFENVLPVPGARQRARRHYVPRVAHTTGDLDIHE